MATPTYAEWQKTNPGGSLLRYAKSTGTPYQKSDSGGFLKTLGSIIPLAAPFLGPWGAVAGLAGGLLAGGDASRTADQYAGRIGNIASQQEAIAGLQPELIAALMQNAGFDPATGTFNPNFNPNAATADSLFDPNSLNGMIVAGQEAGAPAYDNAVNGVRADFLRRGFGGGENSGFNTAVTNIRTDQARSNADARRGLLYNLANQKRAYLMAGQDYGRDSLSDATRFATNSAQGALGTLGGLQGLYQGRADQTNQGITTAIGELSQSGVFNPVVDNVTSWLKNRFGRVGNRRQPSGVSSSVKPPAMGGAAGTVGWGGMPTGLVAHPNHGKNGALY